MSQKEEDQKGILGGCCLLSFGVVFFFVIFGAINMSEYNAFDHQMRYGRIVGRFVSKTNTVEAAKAAMIGDSHWNKLTMAATDEITPGSTRSGGSSSGGSRGGGSTYHGSSGSHSSNNCNEYYVNAIFTYETTEGENSVVAHNCTMTMHTYCSGKSAGAALGRVPLGKVKGIYPSKNHGGKYCIDKHDLLSAKRVGFWLLVSMAIQVGAAILCCGCCGCVSNDKDSVTPAASSGTMTDVDGVQMGDVPCSLGANTYDSYPDSSTTTHEHHYSHSPAEVSGSAYPPASYTAAPTYYPAPTYVASTAVMHVPVSTTVGGFSYDSTQQTYCTHASNCHTPSTSYTSVPAYSDCRVAAHVGSSVPAARVGEEGYYSTLGPAVGCVEDLENTFY